MTCAEFSNEFDILLNSYSNNPSDIKIDEYEKSIFHHFQEYTTSEASVSLITPFASNSF